jgi:aspartate/methionine/tyrosine aminotransferase
MPPALPPLARRTDRFFPFYAMELVKQALALEAQGRSVINMSIGEPDFTAPPAVIEALIEAAQAGKTAYTQAFGITPLREAIAHYYKTEYGVEIAPERVVVTAGASAALTLAACALVNPGDKVLLSDPTYPCNSQYINAFDGVPTLIPVSPETRFQLTAELIDAHWSEGVRGTLIASPANPTGTSIPFEELGKIIETVRAKGGFTIVDEIYLGLTYDGHARSALEYGDDIIVSNSFSKFFNMTGWRLGWLIVPPAFVSIFEKLAQHLFICPSALAQHAALACFTPESMAIYHQRKDEFRARRNYIVPALKALGFGVPVEPDGAFYVYLDCSAFSTDSTHFAHHMLQEIGVAMTPGLDFGVDAPERYLRLSYATQMDQLRDAVERMRVWLPTQRLGEGR